MFDNFCICLRMFYDDCGFPEMSENVWGCLRISEDIKSYLWYLKKYEINSDHRDRRCIKDSNDGKDYCDKTLIIVIYLNP